MHDIGRKLIMGGSSAGGQAGATAPAIVTTSGALNGSAAPEGNSAASNGNHNHHNHHHSSRAAPSAAPSATTTPTSGENSVGVGNLGNSGNYMNNNNNNNCVVKQHPRLIVSSSSSTKDHQQALEPAPHAAAMPLVTVGGGPERPVAPPSVVVVNQQRKTAVISCTSSTSSSSAESSTSSRSSSLSTSPMPVREEEEGEQQVVREMRKVEPLKINLHREPIRTVIKLGAAGGLSPAKSNATVLQANPMVVSSTNEFGHPEGPAGSSAAELDGGVGGGIPKLHIRMNHSSATEEPPIPSIGIPKLTIRNAGAGANCTASASPAEGGSVTVPKLTIKMDHHSAPQVQTPLPRLTIKTNALGNRAVDVLLSPSAAAGQGDQLPTTTTLTVPKLTIKVPNEAAVLSTAGASILSERLSSPGGGASSSSSNNSSSGAAGDGSTIPKLTLKNVGRGATAGHHHLLLSNSLHQQQHHPHLHHQYHHEETPSFQIMNPPVPKLKVKVARIQAPSLPTAHRLSEQGEDEDDVEEGLESEGEEEEEKKKVPRIRKLTIKPLPGHPKTSYGTNQHPAGVNSTGAEASPEGITKLVIKPIPKPESGADALSSPTGNHHPHGDRQAAQPLEIATGGAGSQAGPQSPRIILKINKNQNSIVSNTEVVVESGSSAAEENLLKRHLQQEFVNSTSKRVKGDEKIVAIIDLEEDDDDDDEEEDEDVENRRQKNGRIEENDHAAARRLQGNGGGEALDCDKDDGEQQVAGAKGERGSSSSSSSSSSSYENSEEAPTEGRVTKQFVPGGDVALEESKDGEDDASEGGGGVDSDQLAIAVAMETPPVKRGRGRPRKTPIVQREFSAAGDEEKKPRGRKKVHAEDTPVPAIESVKISRISEDGNLLQSPTQTASVKRPRGGGRGGGRTPGGRGGSARRGRGGTASALRKPFNKERYFKQKTFEESIVSSYFEEDTRMSADTTPSTPKIPLAGFSSQLDPQDSISQSSHLSSTSVTMDSTQTSSTPARKKLKMEVLGAIEGKIEFTVEMLAEYDWPPGVGCCPNKNRDTFMIQEQIAEYLGVKSFKRKYPDLERRTVEMEERNYLIERGLVTEKMCDLGVTAVYAVDVLDIMYQDFHEKYEKYKQYHREKIARDVSLRQKLHKSELGIGAREKAMRAVSKWNAGLNRERKEERRTHMDLQNFTIQVPEGRRQNMTFAVQKPSLYPLAVVVGQFSEYYQTYTPSELGCFPINTALANPEDLMKRVLEEKMARVERQQQQQKQRQQQEEDEAAADKVVEEEAPADSSSDSSSSNDEESNDSVDGEGSVDDDSSSSESEADVNDDDLCCVCAKTQFTSQNNVPEMFVKCAICMKMAHPSCIEMSTEMAKRAFQYMWQCVDCKRCAGCQKADDAEKMLYCQQCDRAYHIYCTKSLQSLPKGPWHCDMCSICHQCGCRNPDGTNNKVVPPLHSPPHRKPVVPEWKQEYAANPLTGLKEHCGMLCVRCAGSRNGPSTSGSS